MRIAPAPGSQASGTWYVDPVLRLWHASDGLARNGRLVKAERVAVSTSAHVEPLEADSVSLSVLTSGGSSFEIEGEIWIEREGADAAPGPDEAEEAEEEATAAEDEDTDWQSEDPLRCADCR